MKIKDTVTINLKLRNYLQEGEIVSINRKEVRVKTIDTRTNKTTILNIQKEFLTKK